MSVAKVKYKKVKYPEYFNVLSGTMGKNTLGLFDPVKGVDIRVDYLAQKTKGSAYKTAPYRLAGYAEAILNDSYDAEIIVIRKGFIPDAFINYFVKEIKRHRFCYFVIAEEHFTTKQIDKLVEEQAKKIYSDIVEWKK